MILSFEESNMATENTKETKEESQYIAYPLTHELTPQSEANDSSLHVSENSPQATDISPQIIEINSFTPDSSSQATEISPQECIVDSVSTEVVVTTENTNDVPNEDGNWSVVDAASGLVLLSTLCELSAKQQNLNSLTPMAVENEVVISDTTQVTTQEQKKPRRRRSKKTIVVDNYNGANVIVERVPNIEMLHNYPSPISVETVVDEPQQLSASYEAETVRGNSAAKTKTGPKEKRIAKALKFPPCFVCGGNASGSHYGVNSCEACKGFFRRYLMRHEEYKCSRGGNCEIININRGNCSGCRLQKCLQLGMAKEKSKLGRYTLARRTETIKEVNKLEGKEEMDSVSEGKAVIPAKNNEICAPPTHTFLELNSEKSGNVYQLSNDKNNGDCTFSRTFLENTVEVLVHKVLEIRPFGPDVVTKQDIENILKSEYEKYQLRLSMFGERKPVSAEDHEKLFKEFGIDIDNRMKILKDCLPGVESVFEGYCNFAKHIPGFSSLPINDRCSLIKSNYFDFFCVLMHQGYCEEYGMFLGQDNMAYHIDEEGGKFKSKEFLMKCGNQYLRWQKLNLIPEEMALICALTLMFTDRCILENFELVDKIQMSMVTLLQQQLMKTCPKTAQRRLWKIIDSLTRMREASEMQQKESSNYRKNKMFMDEMPDVIHFLLGEDEEQEAAAAAGDPLKEGTSQSTA